jgi:hypothetical protein
LRSAKLSEFFPRGVQQACGDCWWRSLGQRFLPEIPACHQVRSGTPVPSRMSRWIYSYSCHVKASSDRARRQSLAMFAQHCGRERWVVDLCVAATAAPSRAETWRTQHSDRLRRPDCGYQEAELHPSTAARFGTFHARPDEEGRQNRRKPQLTVLPVAPELKGRLWHT